MAEYDMEYMQEHCIDVYFRHGGRPFHVLTYGTTIPAALNDVDKNRRIQHQVAVDMEVIMNPIAVHVEQNYITAVLDATRELNRVEQFVSDEDTILQMFKPVAELGFYSYDCIEELENGRGLYRLVAYPGGEMEMHPYDNMPDFNGIEVVERDEERDLIISFRM